MRWIPQAARRLRELGSTVKTLSRNLSARRVSAAMSSIWFLILERLILRNFLGQGFPLRQPSP
jgi:hypothetical protein